MLITLDFESFFDADYTLRKMSTSEYVRDPRFEALCVGIKVGKKKTKVLWGDEIGPGLKKLELEKHEVLCHHTQFDALVLSHHYGIFPKQLRCTLSMARALRPRTLRNDLDTIATAFGRGQKIKGALDKAKGKHVSDFSSAEKKELGLYCAQDVDLTYTLYTEDMLPVFPPKELDIIDLIVKMFTNPVLKLDMPRAKKELKREAEERQKTIDDSGMPLEDITKNKPFIAKLIELGIEPPMKISKTPPYKTIPAFAQTDLEFIALKDHTDPRVSKLVKGRLAAKSTIGGTRIARMIKSGSKGQSLPIYINYCGTHVLRGSGGDKLNYQNMPRAEFNPETGDYIYPSAELRRSIKAPSGQVIVVADSSQIQARLTAWFADDTELLELFRRGSDPYCAFATIAYGRSITKADKLERFVGKVCVLGLGFGMGAPRLQETLAQGVMGPPLFLDISICYRLVNTYRRLRRKIEDFWAFCNNRIIGDMILGREGSHKSFSWGKEYILCPNGLKLHYPGLRGEINGAKPSKMFKTPSMTVVNNASYDTNKGRAKLYGGLLTENLAIAHERCIVYEQMLTINERYRIVHQAHDENVYLAPKKEAQRALDFGIVVMTKPPAWGLDIPIAAEGGFDECYSK